MAEIAALAIPDVKLITPKRFGDDRGFFSEIYRSDFFLNAGLPITFIQDNYSHSAKPLTLRGLHFQRPPFDQAKIVAVPRGAAMDVVADLRRGSPTYGHYVAQKLSEENWAQLFVPSGFAHGFITLMPDTVVTYKLTSTYHPEHESGVRWDDGTLAIDWAELANRPKLSAADLVLSERDAKLPSLADMNTPFCYAAPGSNAN